MVGCAWIVDAASLHSCITVYFHTLFWDHTQRYWMSSVETEWDTVTIDWGLPPITASYVHLFSLFSFSCTASVRMSFDAQCSHLNLYLMFNSPKDHSWTGGYYLKCKHCQPYPVLSHTETQTSHLEKYSNRFLCSVFATKVLFGQSFTVKHWNSIQYQKNLWRWPKSIKSSNSLWNIQNLHFSFL